MSWQGLRSVLELTDPIELNGELPYPPVALLPEHGGPDIPQARDVVLGLIDPIPPCQRPAQWDVLHSPGDLGERCERHGDVLGLKQGTAREQAHADGRLIRCLVDPQGTRCVVGAVLGEQGQGTPLTLALVEFVELDAERAT